MPDRSVKHLHVVAQSRFDPEGGLEYIGAVQDVTERRLSEEALRQARDLYATLSRRQRQVMALVVSGLLNKQIGGESTVKVHRGHVMRKMKAGSLADLLRMAARLGPPLPAK